MSANQSRAAELPFWDRPHAFDPKIFQGREQLACEVCGRMEWSDVHQQRNLAASNVVQSSTPETRK